MKRIYTAWCMAVITMSVHAQLSLPPSGDNQKSSVTQWMGPASVTINYSSPNVHGPGGEDRTGHIWGELVHYGFLDQGYGTSKAAPWRAGANENTTIHFSHDVKINGKDLKAGTYGVFLDVAKEGPWHWIFSTNSTSWGSYFYKPEEDALRIETAPQDAPYSEWLTFGFEDRALTSSTGFLQWEKKKIPFKIEVPNVNEIYVDKMRGELEGTMIGFTNEGWMTAAQFCAQHKINLEEALKWADNAISGNFIGREEFSSLQTKASVLYAMGKDAEADALMDNAVKLPTATMLDVHQYGRNLITAGKNQKALEVFKINKQRNPADKFTTHVGLARGYAALGDKKNAIKHWEVAVKNIPENQKAYLSFYEGELKKLKGGT